jgi:hypothetical protein
MESGDLLVRFRRRRKVLKSGMVVLMALLLAISFAASVRTAAAYSPLRSDSFNYSETATVNNGSGSYSGYSDQTTGTGAEQMNSVSGSTVSASYSYSYQFSSNQGSSTSDSISGAYTWSSGNRTYLNGTDNQIGYSKPVYVWFFMDTSLPVEGTFYALNTQFTVLSKNYSFQLPTEGDKYVQTIRAEGTGQYQRNDAYGVFTASYTWDEYFDPATGYVVGYTYVEQDNGQYQGQAGGFTYTDDVYVTSTSYPLAAASAPSTTTGSTGFEPYLVYVVVLVIALLLVAAVLYIATRRRRESLPKHSPPPTTPSAPAAPPSPPTSWESRVDLGSKPSEQVVIREVAKVNCKYCGTLIPTTVDRCPYCGGPRQ